MPKVIIVLSKNSGDLGTALPLDPQPQPHPSKLTDLFDGDWYLLTEGLENNKKFIKRGQYFERIVPPVVTPEPIRIITVRAWFERFQAIDNRIVKNIRKSQNEDVQSLWEGMKYFTSYIDLDSPIIDRDLAILVTANEITSTEAVTMKIDGVEIEKYNGTL